ncbi:hypothetical protein SAMN04488692_1453 [Halarsenatibacter silvermanii]|uniref:Uncharacterized protein n=1 Tax=Halarsenatibacter silvermanii TaxID=321763 RepID=A0A1G9TQW5_9FIRM|nr:hypothetical protein SAMN04488692_1453 [Halarsenatibacter silvermanii]
MIEPQKLVKKLHKVSFLKQAAVIYMTWIFWSVIR